MFNGYVDTKLTLSFGLVLFCFAATVNWEHTKHICFASNNGLFLKRDRYGFGSVYDFNMGVDGCWCALWSSKPVIAANPA